MKNEAASVQREQAPLKTDLVDALYSTPVAILIGAVTVTVVMAMAAVISDFDSVFFCFSVGMALIGAGRHASHKLYEKHKASWKETDDARTEGMLALTIQKFELFAMVGAWSTAATISAFGAYAVAAYPSKPVMVLAVAQTIGYVAGVASRNTSRPLITRIQVLLAAVPFAVALIATLEPAYILIALSVGLTTMLTFSSAQAIYDVFLSRQKTMEDLAQLATNDTLTNLRNRRGFLQDLDAIGHEGKTLSLLSVDVDNFKTVNDTLGHDVGDALLRTMSTILTPLLAPGDVAARIGGDEFMIATRRPASEALLLADRIAAAVRVPCSISGHLVSTTVSIGVTEVDPAMPMEEALKRVDIALYCAKGDGRNRSVLYTSELRSAHDDRLAFEADMREGMRLGQFSLAFQPIYSPRSGTVTHVEALLRWAHPTRGNVSPAEFIPVAERTGLIKPLGTWALETAARTAMSWPSNMGVTVNISAQQFDRDYDLVAIVDAVLRTTGLQPRRLTLEITESVLIDDEKAISERMQKLRDRGVKIALDDFGTGFSSLSYLMWLPIDTLKIDKTFCREIAVSSRAMALMKAITQLAHDLKLLIIVEGIETQEQLATMSQFSLHGIQGYVFAKPMSSSAFTEIMHDRVKVIRPDSKEISGDMTAKAIQNTKNVA
ncbi:MAG: putative bifunctional diguanylate cyclase/phosphodiesterase [Beijerinckiaceae bacterium]